MFTIDELPDSPYNTSDVVELLEEMDDFFSPPLTERVRMESGLPSLEAYVDKILTLGHVLIHFDEKEVHGVTLFYANDQKQKNAYIAMLAVKQGFHNQGIAKKMVIKAIEIIKKEGMQTISLKTWKENTIAVALYEKIGFVVKEVDEKNIKMQYTFPS
ncbi:GNAT family N-acetyltransferase [uncultured Cyclobacterium sp.]|uniref:GNAT family N-acetyltransferase n=1 Tax=uncultured Cyclobacterium sp. TaxID=453820 RepID=UPI0030EEA4B3|tara:strand:- start:78 stop:551 length:474 start_codon:yes stop_codon:yes gene_type:complete